MFARVTRFLCAVRCPRLLGTLTLALGLCSLWPGDASAQFALRSKIEGTLTDTTGAVLPGATVTLTETTRNQVQTATTDANGLYSFSNLALAPTPSSPNSQALSKPAPSRSRWAAPPRCASTSR